MRTAFLLFLSVLSLLGAQQKPSVAVLPFVEMGTIEEKTGFTLAQKVRAWISPEHYEVLGNRDLKTLFEKAHIQNPLYIAEDFLSSEEISRLQDAKLDRLVTGVISKHYQTFTVSYHIFYLDPKIVRQSGSVNASSWKSLLKKFEEAFRQTQLIVSAEKKTILFNRAMQLFAKEQYDQAIPLLEKAGKAGSASALYNLGWYYENIKKSDQAALKCYLAAGKHGHRKAKSVASRLRTLRDQRIRQQTLALNEARSEKLFENILWKDVYNEIEWKDDAVEDIQWKNDPSTNPNEDPLEGVEWKDIYNDIRWKEESSNDSDILWKEDTEESILWKKSKKDKIDDQDIEWKDKTRTQTGKKKATEEDSESSEPSETSEKKTKE